MEHTWTYSYTKLLNKNHSEIILKLGAFQNQNDFHNNPQITTIDDWN